jgi:hypothetical protein
VTNVQPVLEANSVSSLRHARLVYPRPGEPGDGTWVVAGGDQVNDKRGGFFPLPPLVLRQGRFPTSRTHRWCPREVGKFQNQWWQREEGVGVCLPADQLLQRRGVSGWCS